MGKLQTVAILARARRLLRAGTVVTAVTLAIAVTLVIVGTKPIQNKMKKIVFFRCTIDLIQRV